jgi:dTMP kinase
MRFIVIDGMDGAGKDTHAEFIRRRYADNVIVRTHPSDSIFGKITKASLLRRGKLFHLLAAIFYFLDVIYSLLRYYGRAETVIFVRYLGGVLYLPEKPARILYRFFKTVLPTSPYMFYLEAEPEVCLRRVAEREESEMFENLEDFARVRDKAFKILEGWNFVNTNRPIEETRAEIERILNELDRRFS